MSPLGMGFESHRARHPCSRARVWEYDGATDTWADRQTQGGPSERYWVNAAYDTKDDAVIVFGGRHLGDQYDDTWVYSPDDDSWTRLNVAHHPQARFQAAFAYDLAHDAAVLFGGMTFVNRQNFRDTWILDLSLASPDWRQAGSAPQPEGGTTTGIDGFPAETIFLGMLAFLLYTSSKRRTPRNSEAEYAARRRPSGDG